LETSPVNDLPYQVSVGCLADHYSEFPRFKHLSLTGSTLGGDLLTRVNCLTCNACWLELRPKPKKPPTQVTFCNEDGDKRTLTLPLDPVSLLGSVT